MKFTIRLSVESNKGSIAFPKKWYWELWTAKGTFLSRSKWYGSKGACVMVAKQVGMALGRGGPSNAHKKEFDNRALPGQLELPFSK